MKWFGSDTAHLLIQSSSKVDYYERKERARADQLFGAGNWKECRLTGPTGQRGMVLSGDRGGQVGAYALVMVDGQHKMSGPIDAARQRWKERRAAGWTVMS